jgi:uncharacterized LabA/DUF88 family protein
MERFVVMVDAGYLLRQSLEILSNKSSHRRIDLDITDPAGLMVALVSKAKDLLSLNGRELLRVYWYDGVGSSGHTPQQRSINDLPDLIFRAGTINSAKQQKGVDSLIVTDLLELASNRAMSDAVVITGDGDLAIGIDLSQRKGVRVGIIGIEDLSVGVYHHQSSEIMCRADRVGRMGGSDLSPFMRYVPVAAPAPAPAPAATTTPPSPTPVRVLDAASKAKIEASVKAFIGAQASVANMVDPSTKRIQTAVDKALLYHLFTNLGIGQLTTPEKNYARTVFRTELGV